MLTTPPPEHPVPAAPARSGHGAASVIPRLNADIARPLAEAEEAAAVQPLDAGDTPAGTSGDHAG